MRENRTSGSEGGGTEQSVLPTPIKWRGFPFTAFHHSGNFYPPIHS